MDTAIPYPEVNAVLDLFLANVRPVLGDRFIALYVHGSLAGGDFTPQRSDIDFVVVTDGELPDETFRGLAEMHTLLSTSGLKWAKKLEGSYIPRSALRRHQPGNNHFPALRVDGTFAVDQHGPDWVIQLHILRERGIPLAGPPPASLIDPVQPDELRQAVRETLKEWWLPQLDNTTWLQTSEYQAYAVLTMCRILYTLERGAVAAKTAAGRWAGETQEPRWSELIAWALAWPDRLTDNRDRLAEVLDFIRYTAETVASR